MEVYGIDISWSMLRQGKQVVNGKHISTMHFAHARVEVLPFQNCQFDVAYCGGVLNTFPDIVGSMREISRIRKSGAPLVILTFINRDQSFVQIRRWAEARNSQLVKLHFFEKPELEQVLTLAGFVGFEPLVYGGIITFKVRRDKYEMNHQ